jgi:capsular polysaccharide biosynthesis protein
MGRTVAPFAAEAAAPAGTFPLLAPLRRMWPAVIAAAVLAGGAAYALSAVGPAKYESVSTLLVYETVDPGAVSASDLETSARLASMFSQLAAFDPVLEDAIESGDLPIGVAELRRTTSVQPVAESPLFQVQAVSADPDLSQQIADALAEAIISSNERDGRVDEGTIQVVQPAPPGSRTNSPIVNGLLAALLGAIVVLVVLYAAGTVSGRLRS